MDCRPGPGWSSPGLFCVWVVVGVVSCGSVFDVVWVCVLGSVVGCVPGVVLSWRFSTNGSEMARSLTISTNGVYVWAGFTDLVFWFPTTEAFVFLQQFVKDGRFCVVVGAFGAVFVSPILSFLALVVCGGCCVAAGGFAFSFVWCNGLFVVLSSLH